MKGLVEKKVINEWKIKISLSNWKCPLKKANSQQQWTRHMTVWEPWFNGTERRGRACYRIKYIIIRWRFEYSHSHAQWIEKHAFEQQKLHGIRLYDLHVFVYCWQRRANAGQIGSQWHPNKSGVIICVIYLYVSINVHCDMYLLH